MMSLGNNLSFILRSVFEEKEVVRYGARRRVGSGTCINILNDSWLPSDINPRVTSAHPLLTDSKVSWLMETGSLAWDVDLVRICLMNRMLTLF